MKSHRHRMFARPTGMVALLGSLAVGTAMAQAPAHLTFEVATVRPSPPLDNAAMKNGHFGTKIDASRIDIGTAPLLSLICTAYGIRPYQVSGPEWLKNTTFDIQAKIPAGVPTDKIPDMLRTLLEERFGLKVHHENKEQPVYALIVAKDGAKMTLSAPDPAAPAAPEPSKAGEPPPMEMSIPSLQGEVKITKDQKGLVLEMPGKEIQGKLHATPVRNGTQPMRIHLESSGMTMKTFAALLSVGVLDRPVVDMTSLPGGYELAVDLTEFEAMGVLRTSLSFLPMGGGGDGGNRNEATGVASDPSGSALRPSITKLGLTLDARKLPIDLLVIDHAEKTPTEN